MLVRSAPAYRRRDDRRCWRTRGGPDLHLARREDQLDAGGACPADTLDWPQESREPFRYHFMDSPPGYMQTCAAGDEGEGQRPPLRGALSLGW